jgi:peptide-methionine (S)-S-oxide reductase
MRTTCYCLLPISAAAFLASPNLGRAATSKSHVNAIKEGTFGMGCFWEPAEELLKVDGVVSTAAGYTGNPTATKAPTYDSVCFSRDWVEGVRVKYDDEKITYEQLLDAFYESQKPKVGSRQYSSIIFAHDDEQQKLANNYIQNNAKAQRSDGWMTEWTTIEPLTKFYQAEGYHQDYWQKQRPRFAAIIGLLAVATGVLDPIVPLDFQKTVETGANAAVIAGGLYQALERVLDAKVVEL